jgi:uroporphyrinogen III methyltransferase/synthase
VIGRVYLVGAGPGDPGLITARGLALLKTADAVVHDRLVAPALLEERRPGSEVYDVGKVPGQHRQGRQREINDLLLRLARAGKTVVRLKGGDPFVFGRGGEEAEACAGAGIPFEVIPGVTSAVAVPAYAGIPLTHRSLASSFAVVTGHEDPAKPNARVDWAYLAAVDTLVILMGVKGLPAIVDHLLAHGRSPRTPVAVISQGTYPSQATLVATLADVVDRNREASLAAPATIIIGEVVLLRDRLRWFDVRPLFGRRILVPRTREQPSVIVSRLRELGATVVEVPRLQAVPIEGGLDWALRRLRTASFAGLRLRRGRSPGSGSWLVFTSPAAVDMVWATLEAQGLDARSFAGMCVAATGPGTDQALRSRGLYPDLSTPAYLSSEIAGALMRGGLAGRQVLLLRPEGASSELPERLLAAGAVVEDTAIYRLVPVEMPEQLAALAAKPETRFAGGEAGGIDIVVFPSSGTVRALVDSLQGDLQSLMDSRVVCMGVSTARTATELGFPVDAIAAEATFDGLVETVLSLPSRRGGHPLAGTQASGRVHEGTR